MLCRARSRSRRWRCLERSTRNASRVDGGGSDAAAARASLSSLRRSRRTLAPRLTCLFVSTRSRSRIELATLAHLAVARVQFALPCGERLFAQLLGEARAWSVSTSVDSAASADAGRDGSTAARTLKAVQRGDLFGLCVRARPSGGLRFELDADLRDLPACRPWSSAPERSGSGSSSSSSSSSSCLISTVGPSSALSRSSCRSSSTSSTQLISTSWVMRRGGGIAACDGSETRAGSGGGGARMFVCVSAVPFTGIGGKVRIAPGMRGGLPQSAPRGAPSSSEPPLCPTASPRRPACRGQAACTSIVWRRVGGWVARVLVASGCGGFGGLCRGPRAVERAPRLRRGVLGQRRAFARLFVGVRRRPSWARRGAIGRRRHGRKTIA